MDSPETRARLFAVVYLAHLLVPLYFLADVIIGWRVFAGLWWYSFGLVTQIVFLVAAVWLAVGLGAFIMVRYSKLFSEARLQGPLVMIYALILTVALLESGLQLFTRGETVPALWPPGREALLQTDPGIMPGVYGVSHFTGNEVGLRGPSFPNDDRVYNIVTIGGSTTESLFLDDSEEWPHLIMVALNQRQSKVPVWIANGGQGGRSAVDHLTLMKVLPILDQVDMLIFLIGINDLQPTLAFEGKPSQGPVEARSAVFREQVLHGGRRIQPALPLFKHLQVYKVARYSSASILVGTVPPSVLGRFEMGPSAWLQGRRQQRAEASIVPLPDLQTGLDEYRARIRALAQECGLRGFRCLFLTQPSIWREDLPTAEQELLMFGWVGKEVAPRGYLSLMDMVKAMEAYNRTLLSVCEQEKLECFDLESVVPKDTSSFYDDVHFNEGGGRTVARFITDYLLSKPPFAKETSASGY